MSHMIKQTGTKTARWLLRKKINGKMVFAYAHCTSHTYMHAYGVELYKCVLMQPNFFLVPFDKTISPKSESQLQSIKLAQILCSIYFRLA